MSKTLPYMGFISPGHNYSAEITLSYLLQVLHKTFFLHLLGFLYLLHPWHLIYHLKEAKSDTVQNHKGVYPPNRFKCT